MPLYTYRREDGTTFEIRQSFSDPSLTRDPETGQKVSRVVHNAGVIFKGSGFYKNDHKTGSRPSAQASKDAGESGASAGGEAAKPAEAPAAPPTVAPSAAAD